MILGNDFQNHLIGSNFFSWNHIRNLSSK